MKLTLTHWICYSDQSFQIEWNEEVVVAGVMVGIDNM
jgi:type IV secretory pathway TrbF-like protein